MKIDLVGLSEVAEMAGMSKGTVRVWRVRGHLPPPITELACGPIWYRQTIRDWLREFRPEGDHPKTRKSYRKSPASKAA